MILRQLGLHVQELETGPLTFLLSRSIPVAYVDRREAALPPGVYRTDRYFSKATTAHLNKWLRDQSPYATIPHDLIVQAFQSVSRFSQTPNPLETWVTSDV